VNFQNVNANDITDNMTIRVATVNGIDAETAARNRVLQIRTITRKEFDKNDSYRFLKGELQGYKQRLDPNYRWNVSLPDTVWGDPIISIGAEAFKDSRLVGVTIPNSVISIGNEAFANNKLTSISGGNGVTSIGTRAFKNAFGKSDTFWGYIKLSIPNSVTFIGEEAFFHETDTERGKINIITIGTNVTMEKNSFRESWRIKDTAGFDDGFYQLYNDNGKKAGTYNVPRSLSWRYSPPAFFPSDFLGTWKKDNNTLTFTTNTLKAGNQLYIWNLTELDKSKYTLLPTDTTYWVTDTDKSQNITIQFSKNELKISGDKGSVENNWNGTWKRQ